jgi:sugar/nucleoside kinase (ribokinase family)
MKFDVLVVGDYCFDLILTDLPGEPVKGREIYARGMDITVGGGTFPTAVALRRLGLDVGLHMQLGTDFFSRFAHEIIVQAGFSPDLLQVQSRDFRRLTVALSYPDDRAFLSFADPPPGGLESTRFGVLPLLAHQVRHLHFAHLSAALVAEEMIAEAKRQGMTISTDCGWNPWALDHPRLWEVLGQMDVFLPNEVELKYVTGVEDLAHAQKVIAEKVRLTVVKRGAEGSSSVSGNEFVSVPVIPVAAVESTGAGDCFNAGFIFGWLQGWSTKEALRCGNICGGLSTTSSGWEATPTREGLENWLRKDADG